MFLLLIGRGHGMNLIIIMWMQKKSEMMVIILFINTIGGEIKADIHARGLLCALLEPMALLGKATYGLQREITV